MRLDPVMANIIERIGPMKLRARRLSTFQSLVQAITHQQLSGQAAATILKRFRQQFGDCEFPTPDQVVQIPFEQLTAAGLSRAKAQYIRDIAQRAVDGVLPTLVMCDAMEDIEIIDQLTRIKGIGRWTAEMLLIFNLGRPDILPVHDLGVRRGFQIAYKKRRLPDPERLAEIGHTWSPFRTTAAWYLWRTADFLKRGKW
jgi:3-methyladenine DNA glycosylase/8-oxoguanine DNA glycosylase